MNEREPIDIKQKIERSIRTTLKPWTSLDGNKPPNLSLPDISVIEISRSSGILPARVLSEFPRVINLGETVVRVKKASNDQRKPNIRVKRLIRESVKEPPIPGVRDGRKRLRERVLARKIKQAQSEREKFSFHQTELLDSTKTNEQRREAIRSRLAERALRRTQNPDQSSIKVDESDLSLKTLRSLVRVGSEHIRQIAQRAVENPEIHLFDFANMLGLDPKIKSKLAENSELLTSASPPERQDKVNQLRQIVGNTPTLHSLSNLRIHPSTTFEQSVPLFFGMGGGSQMPCQGLPLDVLKMVLTGEKLRRELGLSKCFVLGADIITYTNIDRTPGFTKEKVDQVIGTEVAILNEVFRRFGFNNWLATRQTQLDQHFPQEQVEDWHRNIEEADTVDFVGGHHYAIEMSDIQLLVPNGVKLGWWIRPLTSSTGYIMDEQPFHARFALVMGLLGKAHATSLLYTHAGSRILLGNDGQVQKEAPYITYTPERRLLLSPFEDVARKLQWAERRGGGLTISFVKTQMRALVDMFEELVTEIPSIGRTENEVLANKLQFIVEQAVGNDSRLAQMWQEAFPNST